MNKTEKKEQVQKLVDEFLSTTDIDTLVELHSKIITEIALCGYDDNLNLVYAGIQEWSKDLLNYILAVKVHELNPDLIDFTRLSLVGLINFVDMSLLPD
ncbi:MAG TPA: hypothetical protein VIJ75_01325 [Hanamia sp.]